MLPDPATLPKVLSIDAERRFLDRIDVWLHDAGYITMRSRNADEAWKELRSSIKWSVVILGDVGEATADLLAELRRRNQPYLITDRPDAPFESARIRRDIAKEEFLAKIREVSNQSSS